MTHLRSYIATILIGLLAQSTAASQAPALPAPTPAATNVPRLLQQFGEGAELKVTLRDGEIRGHIDSLGESSFLFIDHTAATPREIKYSDVVKAGYPHRSYAAKGETNPVAARAMVLTLGVGQHIMVKTGEKKLHGYIVKTDEHSFLIRPDLETDTVDIPYASIRKVHKNLSFGATVAILAGIAAAVVLILVLSGEDEADIVPG